MDARQVARDAAAARAKKDQLDRAEAKEWKRRRREDDAARASMTPREIAAAKAMKTRLIVGGAGLFVLVGLIVLIVLATLSLQRSKMPDLNSVTGRIVRGGEPVQFVRLQLISNDPATEASFTINGHSDEQGNVVISTTEAATGKRVAGVAEGAYTVRAMLPQDANQRGGGTVEILRNFIVKEGANELPLIELNQYNQKK